VRAVFEPSALAACSPGDELVSSETPKIRQEGPPCPVLRANVPTTKPTDENSLANPSKVAPVTLGIDVGESAIRHTFPENSVSLIGVKGE